MAAKRSKKQSSKKKSGSGTITIALSRACAEELLIALINALDGVPNGHGKGWGKGKGGFGPTRVSVDIPGDETHKGRR